MKVRAVFLLLIVFMMIFTACNSSNGNQTTGGEANVTREEAIQTIQDISKGTGDADINSYPESDKIVDGVRYYFIQVVFANKMSAAYFVDENKGNVFVAIGGELDTDNPFPDMESAILSEKESGEMGDITEITVPETGVVKDILDITGKTQEQVKEAFGNDFKKVSVNYDGYMEGFFYSDMGFTVAFGNDGTAARVYCTDQIDINGARAGMDFSQIQEKLGETSINQTWAETPINTVYEIRYSINDRTVVFFSRQEEGTNSIMSIS